MDFGMSDNWKTIGGQLAQNGFEVHLLIYAIMVACNH
jgi:hypothetical protein